MANQKTVRLLKPWRLHAKGATFTADASVADLLIQRGAAEEVLPEPKQKPKKADK